MTYLRIFGAICVLAGVFLFGMWLTWPEFPYNSSGFPINRKFVAVSLNGQVFNPERLPQLPSLEVRRSAFLRFRASGSGGCNNWYSDIELSPARSISWGRRFATAVACRVQDTETRYLRALHKAVRWRTQDGFLILEDDTDVLRFARAPK